MKKMILGVFALGLAAGLAAQTITAQFLVSNADLKMNAGEAVSCTRKVGTKSYAIAGFPVTVPAGKTFNGFLLLKGSLNP